MGVTVTCPTNERWPDDIVGCGLTFTAEPDDEGLVDCPGCGIWFPASRDPKVGEFWRFEPRGECEQPAGLVEIVRLTDLGYDVRGAGDGETFWCFASELTERWRHL